MAEDRRDGDGLPRAKRVDRRGPSGMPLVVGVVAAVVALVCVGGLVAILLGPSAPPPLDGNPRLVADHAQGATREQIEGWYGKPATRFADQLGQVTSVVYEKMGPNGVYTYSYTFNFIDGRCVGVTY